MKADLPQRYTPAQIAKAWGIGPDKVLDWIRRGELVAVNLASHPNGRPRWSVGADDLREFELRRASRPANKPTTTRRRKPSANVIEYF